MPCSDSSSSISFQLDQSENFLSFEYAKITCGREITAETGLTEYFKGKCLTKILTTPFATIASDLNAKEEEKRFILYMEWDALCCAIVQYLGTEDEHFDYGRCKITSVEENEKGVEVALVILPPKELPKILPCNLAQDTDQ